MCLYEKPLMDIALTLSMGKIQWHMWPGAQTNNVSPKGEHQASDTAPEENYDEEKVMDLKCFFVLEDCNYSPESQGIITRAPSVNDRRVGGENENQRYRVHLSRRRDITKVEHYYTPLHTHTHTHRPHPWKGAKSEVFLSSIYLRALLIFSCSFVCFSFFFPCTDF